MTHMGLAEVAVRWEDVGWVAYNFGHPPPYCSPSWSSRLGAADLDEVFILFRNSNITILPSKVTPRENPPQI